MGMYANWDDVVESYPDINSNREEDEIENLISYAEAEINSRLGSKYTVPFASTNITVKVLTIDLTYVRALYRTDKKKYEQLKKVVDDRIAQLLSGKAVMVDSGGEVVSGGEISGAVYSSTENYTPVFDMDAIEDQYIDPDQLEDISNARD
jgi:phage gp36-like protein